MIEPINTAPISAEQWQQEENDRARRLRANGLEEFADPVKIPNLIRVRPVSPWLPLVALGSLGVLAYYWTQMRKGK